MSSKKRIGLVLLVCMVLVGLFAVIHNSTRVKVPENSIAVVVGEAVEYIDIDKLELTKVSGQTFNKKGETKDISGQGILLRDVLSKIELSDCKNILVSADDEYSAELDIKEVMEDDTAYLIIDDNEARLYVFDNTNSRRNVSNVVKITVN